MPRCLPNSIGARRWPCRNSIGRETVDFRAASELLHNIHSADGNSGPVEIPVQVVDPIGFVHFLEPGALLSNVPVLFLCSGPTHSSERRSLCRKVALCGYSAVRS